MNNFGMESNMKRIAIITGASSGMGKEFALEIDKKFNSIDEIWIVARRKELLEELRDNINKPCLLINEDITEKGFYLRLSKILKQENVGVKILINCAGYGIVGNVGYAAHDVSIGMINTNCVGLTSVIHVVLPYMMKQSRIINLASSAAFLPQPDFAIYAASKSYVLSFSRALNCELRKREIFVTAVCPGPVATDFFRIAEDGEKKAWFKDLFMAEPEQVVKKALCDSVNKKEISIYGIPMNLFYLLTKLVPHRIILKIYSGLMK